MLNVIATVGTSFAININKGSIIMSKTQEIFNNMQQLWNSLEENHSAFAGSISLGTHCHGQRENKIRHIGR